MRAGHGVRPSPVDRPTARPARFTAGRRAAALGLVAVILLAMALSGCQRQSTANPAPSATLPQQVHMIDARVGWGHAKSLVLRTSDGGSTWFDVTPKEVRGAFIAGADYLDADHGWLAVAGGAKPLTVYRTADGGKSWARTPTNFTSLGVQVQFIDVKRGWIMVHQGVAAGSEAVTLLGTDDGGATWTIVNEGTPKNTAPGRLPFGGGKTGFGFSDDKHGWVTGYQPVEGRAYLFVTSDGGATWRATDLPLPRDHARSWLSTLPPSFFSATEGLLPVTFGEPGQPTAFYATHDGGKTWEAGAPVISPGNNSFSWSFADMKHGFATDGGHLYATADGGATWAEVSTNQSFAEAGRLQFVSDQTGWAAGDNVLLKTTDGGKTWTPVKPGQ